MTNIYGSRKYEFDFGKGVYDKILKSNQLKKILGGVGDSVFVRGSSKNLMLIQRIDKNSNEGKEIINVHSEELETMQSELEKITGIDFSKYRTD